MRKIIRITLDLSLGDLVPYHSGESTYNIDVCKISGLEQCSIEANIYTSNLLFGLERNVHFAGKTKGSFGILCSKKWLFEQENVLAQINKQVLGF